MTDFEREDAELAAVMKGRFIDATKEPVEEPISEPVAKPIPNKKCTYTENVPNNGNPVGAVWMPIKQPTNYMGKLKTVAKDVSIYAVLSVILFWWQQSGRLDETTAWYALLVCVGMVFFSIGKNFRGGVQ